MSSGELKMGSRNSLIRLRGRAADEGGYVMIIALIVMVVTLAFATAALTGTLATRSSATRDLRSQRALQAADAGVEDGIYRFNQVNVSTLNFTGGLLGSALSSITDCVIPQVNLGGVITAFTLQAAVGVTNGACALPSDSGVSGPIGDTIQVGNHGFYEMQQVGGATTAGKIGPNIVLHPKVVAVGVDDGGNSTTCTSTVPTATTTNTAGCVVRRVMATLAPIDPFQLVEAGGNLTLNGAAIVATGDMRADGNLSIPGIGLTGAITGTNALNLSGLTANITYGGAFTHATLFVPVLETFTHQSGAVSRDPVTVDDTGCPLACVTPSLPSGVSAASLGGKNGAAAAYDAIKNTINLTSSALTFAPGDYVLCNFNATGGSVSTNIASTSSTPVRIFIDSPTSSRCSSNGLGATQGNFNSSVGVSNLVGGVIGLTGSSQLQIYLVGNGTANGTTATIGGGLTESMFLYAPMSSVNISGLAFEGNAIGNDVTLNAVTLLENLAVNDYSLANAVGVFHVAHYTECTPVYPLPEPDPTSGC
jgi:Tfp pilus assembly protein PilX